MDLDTALRWVSAAMAARAGCSLREPEVVILRGTWRGLTYEQMANDSEYSTNYLMRDVAPKLWKQLSSVFGRSVGKTNFRVALEAYAAANASMASELLSAEAPEYSATGQDAPSLQATRDSGRGVVDMVTTAARREADHGWLINGEGAWASARASLLAVESIIPGAMYGREDVLAQLIGWLNEAAGVEGHSRLIGLWGLRGVGKTLLVETAVSHVGAQFEGVVWRSLQDQPTLNDFSVSILSSLGMSAAAGQATPQLLSVLASRPLLIVLEGAESLLKTGALAGEYSTGHRSYVEFFQSMTTSRSCVVLTGLEGPNDWVRQGSYEGDRSVRSLMLSGLSHADAITLLESEQLSAPAQWPALIRRYQGHPLALKSVARVIREIFNGRVDTFLSQSSVLFNGIFQLLSPAFDRLSVSETSILYWLASYELPLSLSELQSTLPLDLRPAELISALGSLKQRSLLTVESQADPPTFLLPALVKSYAVHQFMGQFSSASQLTAQTRPLSTYAPLTQVINLSPMKAKPVQLSRWFQGQFEEGWRSLDWLFEAATRPAMRLRSAYHLRDETFIKRCKVVTFTLPKSAAIQPSSSALATPASPSDSDVATTSEQRVTGRPSAILLVAVHQDVDSAFKVCVQAQPAKGEGSLPAQLDLKLLDSQQSVLAIVRAEVNDTFIQLPYFRGEAAETFQIELSLADSTHTETFVI